MQFRAIKAVYQGIIFTMISILFFSCSSSRTATSASSGKRHTDIDEDKFKGAYYNGLKQKILGNFDEAMDIFRKCLAINPYSPAANYEVADILEINKQPDSSLVYIRRAVNGDPANIWYRNFYAENLQELGRYKDVIKVYEDLVKMHPNTTDFYYKLALTQLQAGQYKEAINAYNTLEKKEGSVDEDISMNKIEMLEKIREYSKAEEEIKKLIKNDPSTPQYYDMLGNLYELKGKDDKAMEEYQQTEQLYPHDPMVHLSLADYYKIKNEGTMAFEELEKAFEEPSLDIDTKVRIVQGLSTFTKGDSIFIDAMILSKKMVEANPTEPKAHAIFAELLLKVGNAQRARDQYRIAVGEDSSRLVYWDQLLEVENRLNDVKDMEKESREALDLFPTNAQLYYFNGFANMQMRNYDAALSSFKSGVMYVLDDTTLLSEFYTFIGDVGYYTRHFSISDSGYEAALKINPNNDYVMNNYSYFLSVRDTNLLLADSLSKRANEIRPYNDAYEDTYAWILYMLGKFQDAKEWESKAMAHGGERDPTILEHYGDILFKLGEKDSAMEYWKRAEERGGNSPSLDKKIKDKQL